MRHTQLAFVTVLVAFLVACGSKVPLTEPAKVEDRTGQAHNNSGQNPNVNSGSNNAGAVSPRDVKPVDTTNQDPTAGVSNVVYFDFDSFVIKPEAQNQLAAHAKRLAGNRDAKVSLAGHTDDLGGREYNLALGQKRADAVKKALSILGATEAQMESVSYGKEKPANAGTDDAARGANRRVEIAYR